MRLWPAMLVGPLVGWDNPYHTCPMGTIETIHTTLLQWVLLKLSIPHLSHGQLSTPYLACSMGDYPYHTCPMRDYPYHTCPKGDYSDHTYPMGDYPYRWPLLALLLDEEEYSAAKCWYWCWWCHLVSISSTSNEAPQTLTLTLTNLTIVEAWQKNIPCKISGLWNCGNLC